MTAPIEHFQERMQRFHSLVYKGLIDSFLTILDHFAQTPDDCVKYTNISRLFRAGTQMNLSVRNTNVALINTYAESALIELHEPAPTHILVCDLVADYLDKQP